MEDIWVKVRNPRTDLHQVVVWPVEVFVQLDHQALEERGELLLLLPRL